MRPVAADREGKRPLDRRQMRLVLRRHHLDAHHGKGKVFRQGRKNQIVPGAAVAQRHQVRFAGMDVSDQAGIRRHDVGRRLFIDGHSADIKLHAYRWMADSFDNVSRFPAGGHEICAVARGIGLKANHDVCGGSDVAQAAKEGGRLCKGFVVAQAAAIAVLRRAEYQSSRPHQSAYATNGAQMLERRLLCGGRSENVQSRRAKEQGLHSGNFDTPAFPPSPYILDLHACRLVWFGKILSRRNVDGIDPVTLEQSGNAVVFRDVPGNIGNRQPHLALPSPAALVRGSDWA